MGQSCSVADAAGAQALRGEEGHARPLSPRTATQASDRPSRAKFSGAEPSLPIRVDAFRISRRRPHPNGPDGQGWRKAYTQGERLGVGATANVFEAETGAWAIFGCGRQALQPIHCVTEGFGGSGRRVAMKRFKNTCEEAFKMELKALFQVGVHPNIVRLLEDYQGFGGENVLIYEYCDGLNLWNFFVSELKKSKNANSLLISRLFQQLLVALEHINACGVEHRDVKPENVFLHRVSVPEQHVELKLGDFGWASGRGADVPPQGAGSLWYAPPELNPPVDSLDSCSTTEASTPALSSDAQAQRLERKEQPGSSLKRSAEVGKEPLQAMKDELAREPPKELRPFGKADMWSAGVVLYLLLVGHNPFQAAMQKDKKTNAIEQEVLRMVARGEFDDSCQRWQDLSGDAMDLISSMMQVTPQKRPSPSEALRHPYLMRSLARSGNKVTAQPAWRLATCEDAWGQLDGFQRLGWVAVARSVGETEIHREVICAALRSVRARAARGVAGAPHSAYLLQLAREISALPMHEWLLERGAWDELLRLAFGYLDVDGDNLLSAKDLASHIAAPAADVVKLAESWIVRWEGVSRKGLSLGSLRTALLDPFCTEGDDFAAEDGLLHFACEGVGHAVGLFDEGKSNLGNASSRGKLMYSDVA